MKVVLSGVVAGLLLFVVVGLSVASFAEEALVGLRDGARYPKMGGDWFFAVDLLMGIWAMWTYAMIRPRFRTATAAAGATAVSWWIIKSLQSAHWIGLGLASTEVGPELLVASFVSVFVAAFGGALLFERTVESPSRTMRPLDTEP